MNALGLILLGSIVHATGFAVLGILVYLVLRRRGPAAGSLAAGASLLIMVLVSVVVLGPWPRWWTLTPGSFGSPAADVAVASGPPAPGLMASAGAERSTLPSSDATNERRPESPRDVIAPQPTLLTLLLEELRRLAMNQATSRWGWPEWLAVGFFASLALGLVRLGLGLWGMRRLAARTSPIDDRGLYDAVEILRAELSCTRSVEVRELAGLSTPATIGWRRPLLLLPADWRDWSPDELRAVLAHELARRPPGRFPGGVRGAAWPGAALLSSPGALAGGPAPAGAGAGGRRLGRPALGRQAVVSRDAGPDGLAPR